MKQKTRNGRTVSSNPQRQKALDARRSGDPAKAAKARLELGEEIPFSQRRARPCHRVGGGRRHGGQYALRALSRSPGQWLRDHRWT